MKLALHSSILLLLLPISNQAQIRNISEPTYWSAIRAADNRVEGLPRRTVTKTEILTGIKRDISTKDVHEYLPPDREKFTRSTYENGKISTFELIKVGSDHYCREAAGSWVKSKTWCGPHENYGDPLSSDTQITVELVGDDKGKVEHYQYRSIYVGWNKSDERRHFTEINTWIDSQKRVTRSETRRGVVDSDQRIFVLSEDYEYEPFNPALEIKAPTKNTKRSK